MPNKQKKFSQIYDKYVDKIYRFIYLKVGSEEIAQDICSETFLRGWKVCKLKDNEIENYNAFLYQIARNLVIDFYRKKEKTRTIPIEDYLEIDNINSSEDIEKQAILASDINSIKKALLNIKEDYQDVIIWHFLDDLSISETAKLLDRTEDATRVLLHRALTTLRATINSDQRAIKQ